MGQRIKKTANGVTTKFVGGLYESTGTANTKHLFAAGMRIATIENNAPIYYHADHLGSANVLTDDAGILVDVFEYEPFGELVRHDMTENQEEGYLYTDQYRDNESELYYYNARYYNPSIGRFITPDWIVQAPSHSQSFNRYSYVWNNPINAIDPTGNVFIPPLSMLSNHSGDTSLGSFLDGIQLGLGAAGMAPGVGIGPDLASAAISALRLDPIGFAMDGFSAIPVVGQFVRGSDFARMLSKTDNAVKLLDDGASLGKNLPDKLFHYTSADNIDNILENSLRQSSDGFVYTTPKGDLSPLQAQIELGLSPNRGLPNAIIEIDTKMLDDLGIKPVIGPRNVINTPNTAGGGVEILFEQRIPGEALRILE